MPPARHKVHPGLFGCKRQKAQLVAYAKGKQTAFCHTMAL